LILKVKNHLFLAPDNGLLTAVWERNRADASAWRLDLGRLQGLDIRALSATFHGRDLYAPLAAVLASGVRSPEDLGEPTGNFVLTSAAGPVVESGRVAGIVITIDHFGNLITNIEADLLLEYQSVSVLFEGIVLALKRTYSDGQPGELISVVNSFGVIEIAQVQGNAALTLGATRGTRVEVLGQVRT
jgi:S-adenosylmethionine hydrolase